MSEQVRVDVGRLSAIFAILVSVAGLVGAWFVLPYRMEAAEAKAVALERRIETMEVKLALQAEFLARIDENVKIIKERGR